MRRLKRVDAWISRRALPCACAERYFKCKTLAFFDAPATVVRAGAGDWIEGVFLILCSQVGSSVTSSNFRSTSSLSNLRRLLMIVSSPWPAWGSEASHRYPQLVYRQTGSAA